MVDLTKIIKPDGILPVFYNGYKSVISHDSNYDCYNIIIVDVSSDNFCDCIPIYRIFDETEMNIIPRRENMRLMWEYLINTDTNYEPDF